jgi:hypothetical protein
MRTLRGLALLGLMVARSRFRLGGAYWAWRRETAEGANAGFNAVERWHAVLEYARWLDRMRGIGRS